MDSSVVRLAREAIARVRRTVEDARQRRATAAAFDDTRSWVDPAGYRLSDRIWRARQADRAAIDTLLRQSLARGDDPLTTATALERYLLPGARQTAAYPRSGRGMAAARRLARTETTRAFGAATIAAVQRSRFVRWVRWNLSPSHPKADRCDGHARGSSADQPRGVYLPTDVPRYPDHPNCLCYLTPVAMDPDEALAELRGGRGATPSAPSIGGAGSGSSSGGGQPPAGGAGGGAGERPPVSRGFRLPGRGAQTAEDLAAGQVNLYEVARQALAAIDRVHVDGVLPRIPIHRFNLPGDQIAAYLDVPDVVAGEALRARALRMNVAADFTTEAKLSFVHEVGHFLDLAAIGKAGDYATDVGDPILGRWLTAVRATEAVAALNARRAMQEFTAILPDGTTGTYAVQHNLVDYLLRSDELWARSYAQYIAERSGDVDMLAALDLSRPPAPDGQMYPIQWDAADFAPVAAAIDALFRELGWIR